MQKLHVFFVFQKVILISALKIEISQGPTYTKQEAFINFPELLLGCTHFDYSCKLPEIWNKKTIQIDLLSSLKLDR